MKQRPLGNVPRASHPHRQDLRRTPGRGTGIEHSPGATRPTTPDLLSVSPLVMCNFVSHGLPELRTPLPHRLVAEDDPASQHHLLHLAQAQRPTSRHRWRASAPSTAASLRGCVPRAYAGHRARLQPAGNVGFLCLPSQQCRRASSGGHRPTNQQKTTSSQCVVDSPVRTTHY